VSPQRGCDGEVAGGLQIGLRERVSGHPGRGRVATVAAVRSTSWTDGSIVVGCATFGGIGGNTELIGKGLDDAAAWATLDEAAHFGLRMLDTAERYAGGASDRIIGGWLADRDQAMTASMRITTKVAPASFTGGTERFDTAFITAKLAVSLERLGVERADTMLLHAPDDTTPIEDSLEALESIRRSGRAEHIGACNLDATRLRAALAAAERLGFGCYDVVQNPFNLLASGDGDVQAMCVERGIAYTAYSPLAAGALTGKYRRGERPPDGTRLALRPDGYDAMLSPAVHDAIDRLADDAARLGVSCGALALAWVTNHPAVTAAVVGPSRTSPHLGLASQALQVRLGEDDHDRIAASFRAALDA
jgi:aryl-alcohol dehydrogenase-like predicted oxidoreductase